VCRTRALVRAAASARRDRTAAVTHDIEGYHITPQQAARIAYDAHVKLLAFDHSCRCRTDDGSLSMMPIGSGEVRVGRLSGDELGSRELTVPSPEVTIRQ
jgi:hypothetical protein